MKQSPKSMAHAGFMYTGYSDKVRCFKCGLCVHNWLTKDDPMSEHFRLGGSCLYFNTVGHPFSAEEDYIGKLYTFKTNL
jgi:hypothetical protein